MSFRCRFCSAPMTVTVADLGATPWSNSFLLPTPEALANERRTPLRAMVCMQCFLVQTTENVPATEIFTDGYVYLSSYSTSWLKHASDYADAMMKRFGLGKGTRVVEIASNDGYLLQYFLAQGMKVLGIEPAANAAAIAMKRGIPCRVEFFNRRTAAILADEGVQADLMVANNVLAHVPDIADFVGGFALLLRPQGVATFEFPHLLRMIESCQFDTIYHEHYSYLSLLAIQRIFEQGGLEIFDVEKLPTHGGSLRVYVQRCGAGRPISPAVAALQAEEQRAGLHQPEIYMRFDKNIAKNLADFRAFLYAAKSRQETVAAFGAAAKGNTFLNVCGATTADIAFVVDRNEMKQGRLLPGSHIPVRAPEHLHSARPAYLLVLPWNLAQEICAEVDYIRGWGGRFVIAIPELRIF
jgi:SAM-dependent methyltransferase